MLADSMHGITHVKVKLLWCDHFDVQRKKYSKDKVFQIGFIVNSKKVKAKTYNGKKKKIKTADGKRRDEEGCEMGVWVVLSGGRGGGKWREDLSLLQRTWSCY